MEEDKVLDTNIDSSMDGDTKTSLENNKGFTSTKSVQEEVTSQEKGSLWENFKEVKKASTSKPKSSISEIKDELDEDEVFFPENDMSKYIASTAGGFTMEDDDLDCYDRYEAQINDLPEQMQNFCDQFDIRLKSHVRK
ncbi:hypothetical protein Tco_1531897 [Tanacetum coccineum]